MERYFAWGAITFATAGAMWDIRTHRLPNTLTYCGIVSGIFCRTLFEGWQGMGQSLLGGLIGGGVFLLFFLVQGLGAGDVKLMTAIGSWAGLEQSLVVLLATAIAGGALAVVYMVCNRRVEQTMRNIDLLVRFHRKSGLRPHPEINLTNARCIRIPYAIAIAAGTLYTFGLMTWGG
jgi:prepilin peptidase CpaA